MLTINHKIGRSNSILLNYRAIKQDPIQKQKIKNKNSKKNYQDQIGAIDIHKFN